jgi:hypothetical protein
MKHRLSSKAKALVGSLKVLLEQYRAPKELATTVAVDFYESLDTPISLSCEILLRYGEWETLLTKTVDPLFYDTPLRYFDDACAVAFLKKVPFPKGIGIDPEAAARKKFWEAEEACRLSNIRFRSFVLDPLRAPERIRQVLWLATRKINEIIGDDVDTREWLYACRFGPGTFSHTWSKGLTSLYDKLQVQPSVSYDMKDVGALLVMSQPQWARSITDTESLAWPLIRDSDLDLVPGNKVAFVPKTAVTHRTIAIEPLVNIYAQLGLGACLRRRLKRVGCDLDDQSPNQRAALEGSITDSLATLDLSSASDTVAKEVVRFLLPDGWFRLLDMVRSKSGSLDGKWFRYEKFSSMGNGSTFELETLIFLGLAHGCCRHLGLCTDQVLVYGDDIVIPVAAYDLLVEVLEFCGFSVNTKKSFSSGPFRESCGKDYYNGVEVRPFFLKEIPDETQSLFRLANGIRMLAHRRNSHLGCDVRLRKPWLTVVRALPRPVAQFCRVPAHAGDSDGLKSNWDESQRSPLVISNKDGWEGVFGIRYQAVPLLAPKAGNFLGAVASQLYRLADEGKFDVSTLRISLNGKYVEHGNVNDSRPAPPRQGRGVTYRLRIGSFYGPWTDLGPWL